MPTPPHGRVGPTTQAQTPHAGPAPALVRSDYSGADSRAGPALARHGPNTQAQSPCAGLAFAFLPAGRGRVRRCWRPRRALGFAGRCAGAALLRVPGPGPGAQLARQRSTKAAQAGRPPAGDVPRVPSDAERPESALPGNGAECRPARKGAPRLCRNVHAVKPSRLRRPGAAVRGLTHCRTGTTTSPLSGPGE